VRTRAFSSVFLGVGVNAGERDTDWECIHMGKRSSFAWATLVAIAVCIAALAGPSVVFAADNSSCLGCHEGPAGSVPAQAFDVGAVDRDTVCAACHAPGMLGTHPYHQAGANCGAYCHPGWGESLLTATPNYTDPSGATFASATSKSSPSSVIHIIHSEARWPKNVDTADSRCASCHSVAACSACHVDAPTVRHADHSSTTQSEWTGTTGHGVVAGDQTIYSAGPDANLCSTAGCHHIDTTKTNRPTNRENFSHPAASQMPANVVALSPSASSWRERYGPLYSLGRMSYSNVANATHTTTFEGQKFQLIADKDPYRGIAEVWLDGVLVATVDLYAPTTTNQVVEYESDTLSAGAHTVSIKVTGTKNPASRYGYVTMDCLKVYAALPDSIAPACLAAGCHADKASDHGGSFDHEATQTAGLYPAGRFDCTDCHSLGMWAEHGRTSSKTEAAGCSACHPVYADYTLDEFSNPASPGYGSCTWAGDGSVTGCHQLANSEQPHNFIDSDHDASGVAATADCRACHGDDLSVIHDDTNASRGQHSSLVSNGWATDCLTCHGPDVFPSTRDCTDSGCHTGSGVVDMVSHPAPPHNGSNANAGVPRTGGELCSTCHILELTSEHGKSSSLTDPGDAAIGCADCHNASFFPAGWLDTPNTTNTCNACHDPAGAVDAGLPHESAEYTSKHDWSATEGGCDGALCHDTDKIDLIHTDPFNATVSDPRGSSCQSCHTTPNAVPTVTTCSDCHGNHDTDTAHDPNATPALTAANADCLTCHTKFDKAAGLIFHGGMCYTCHNHLPTNDLTHYLQDNYEARCTDCHNSTVLGTYDYQPYDPNHYDPYLAEHTATGMGTAIANKTCSSCHATSLKAEHTFTLSSGAVECFECHTSSAPIDAAAEVAASWTNDACADCHGSNHGAAGLATHDLSASATSLGCSAGGCHSANTDDIATLHLAAVDGGSNTSCNVCHTNADTDLSAISGCDDCHTGHDLTVHEVSTDTGNCLNCHDEGAPAADLRGLHPTCDTCHNNGSYPGITAGKTSDCVECHAAGLVAEPHNDPNGNYSPYDANHYNGTEAIHTADGADTGYANTDGNSCVSCHLLEMKPEHFKATSAFSGVPGTYGDKCVACHEVNVDGFAGAWTDRCVACHTTGSSHTGFNTVHNAPASYDTSCGGGGCHDTDNVDLIHKNSVTGNATVTTCLNTCHDTNTAVPASVNCDTAGCHAGGHGHELDLTGSDYDNATISGCTNSGSGCHDTSAGTDYQVYHPASGCTDGLCHVATLGGVVNPSKATHVNPNTCQDCHDGTYTNAPDAVGLVDTSGHYSVTLHMPTGITNTARGFVGGTASATCKDCHALGSGTVGLYNQHQGLQTLGATTCADCHNYSAGVTAQVAANWTNNACADCHNGTDMPGKSEHGTTAPVVTATEAGGAGSCQTSGCHTSLNLHELHKGDGGSSFAGCNLSGCHDYAKQGWKPTATSCGTGGDCHTTDAHDPNAHDTSVAGDTGGCTRCHESTNIKTIHSDNCGTCHNMGSNLGGTAGMTADCVTCHDGYTANGDVYYNPLDTPAYQFHYDSNVTTHTETADISGSDWGTTDFGVTLNYYYPDTTGNSYERPCAGCHTTDLMTEHTKNTVGFSTVPVPDADVCVACHELKVDNFVNPWSGGCAGESSSCHSVASGAGGLHRTAGSGWTEKHNASSWSLTTPGTAFFAGGGPVLGAGFSDGFETNNFNNWTSADTGAGSWTTVYSHSFSNLTGWTINGTDWTTAGPGTTNTGGSGINLPSQAVRTNGTANTDMRMDSTNLFNLSSFSTARITLQLGAQIDHEVWAGGTGSGDRFDVEFRSGANTYLLSSAPGASEAGSVVDLDAWGQSTESLQQLQMTIPAAWLPNLTSTSIRLVADVSDASFAEYMYVDDILVEGQTSGTGGWSVQSAVKSAGTYAARAVGTGPQWYNLTKTGIDNSNADSVNVSYAIRWDNLEAADDVVVQYTTNNGGAWTDIKNYAPAGSKAWTTETFTGLPATVNGVRFRLYADNSTGDLLYIDAVTVTPQSASGSGATAASCQNNPNGTECHNVADVANIHARTANSGCPICHTSNTAHPTIKNCQNAGCHVGVNIDEHIDTGSDAENHHETVNVFGGTVSFSQCTGCHDDDMANDHFVLTANTARQCSVCHKTNYTPGTYSPTTAIVDSVIDAGAGAECDDCHTTSTKSAPHRQRQGTTSTLGSTQFDNSWSGHRVYSSMTGVVKTWTAGGASNVSWNWTSTMDNRVFQTTTLQPGNRTLNSTTMIYCNDCHDYSGALGPHGAAMTISLESGYNNTYTTGALYNNNGTWNDSGAAGVPICEKCHKPNVGAYNSQVHNRGSDHWGTNYGACTGCHVKIPHAWKRPRLLGYTTDPAPYASTRLTGVSNRSHNDGASWSAGDCSTSGCDTHSTSGTPSNGNKFP